VAAARAPGSTASWRQLGAAGQPSEP
jgi:hypothetical protein